MFLLSLVPVGQGTAPVFDVVVAGLVAAVLHAGAVVACFDHAAFHVELRSVVFCVVFVSVYVVSLGSVNDSVGFDLSYNSHLYFVPLSTH